MSNLPWMVPGVTPAECGNSETEALQTDVMRFMAILGLCLMAIFALLQSIPMLPVDQPPQVEHREQFDARIAKLQTRVVSMQRQIARMQAASQQARGETEKALQQATRAQRSKRQARQREQQLQQRLGELAAKLAARDQQLRALRERNDAQQSSLRSLRRSADQQAQQLQLTQAQLDRLAQPAQPPPTTVPANPEPAPTAAGFSLRFDSEQALQALVTDGAVSFYARVGSRVWLFSSDGDQRRFALTSAPTAFHEMQAETVPEVFVSTLRHELASFDPQQVRWGVTLPEAAQRQIRQLMAASDGGVLSIAANGEVRRLEGGK